MTIVPLTVGASLHPMATCLPLPPHFRDNERMYQRSIALLTEANALEQIDELMHWAKTTKDGSRSDLDFRPMPAVWELVESDSSNCLGKKCPDYSDCFYYKARRNMQNAQIFIVN